MARELTPGTKVVTHGSVTLKIDEVNRNNRTIYSVSHKENGKRQLKPFGDIGTAMTWAIKRAKKIDKDKIRAVTLSPDEGAVYLKAQQILKSIGKTLNEVAREYVDAHDTLGRLIFLRRLQGTLPDSVKSAALFSAICPFRTTSGIHLGVPWKRSG